MKPILPVLQGLVLSALLGLPALSQTTYYVNDGANAGDVFTSAPGNDGNAGTSPAAPKLSLASAMSAAGSGDRILVDAGTYLINSLTVKDGIKVVGTCGNNTILTVQSGPINLNSGSELWNLKIQRVIPAAPGGAPTISVATTTGGANIRIENCFFEKNRTAIYINPGGTNIQINRNRFDDNRTGIIVPDGTGSDVTNLQITENQLTNNRSYGVIFSDNATFKITAVISNNTITGNLAGGVENNNTTAGTAITLRNNWFGSASPAVYTGKTNGGFFVDDHFGAGYSTPGFYNTNALPGVSYPNQISGLNTAAFGTATHAPAAPGNLTTCRFISSNSPAFAYYTTVQEAIDNSADGAVISIPDGIYNGDVQVTKRLTVQGTSQTGTILKGLYAGAADAVTLSAPQAIIRNLTVTRDFGGVLDDWRNSLKTQGLAIRANDATVDQVLITGNRNGLYINNWQTATVTNNVIENNWTGVHLVNNVTGGIIRNNIIRNNFTHGLLLQTATAAINATNLNVRNNSIAGNWYAQVSFHGANGGTFTGADFSCNTYGVAPTADPVGAGEPPYVSGNPSQFGGTAPPPPSAPFKGNQVAAIGFSPWLPSGTDADVAASGFQLGNAVPVSPTGNTSATDNDFRVLANAIGCAVSGQSITLSGTFDWTNATAAAEWAKGKDGNAATDDDNYSILAPSADNVTLTAASPGAATVKGPGDLASVNLESFLTFDGGSNKNWTISNLNIYDFDLGIGFFSASSADAFQGTQLLNNTIRVPKDLNPTAAPADVNQNIGIHLSTGKNQIISGNTLYLAGDGESENASVLSSSVGLQSNTSGGTLYDGLQISNNKVIVTGLPNATADKQALIRGIWENGGNTDAKIDVTGNTFENQEAANSGTNNRQFALVVTSTSGASKKVTYANNEVKGFAEGVSWIGGPYTSYSGLTYLANGTPAEVLNNKFDGVKKAVVIRKSPSSANTGSPGLIRNNSFANIPAGGFAVVNEATGTADATCNWYSTPNIQDVVSNTGGGSITFLPRLSNGNDADAAAGFQLDVSNTCESPVKNLTQHTTFQTIQSAVDAANSGDILLASDGTYNEDVVIGKPLTLRGQTQGGTIVKGLYAGSSATIRVNAADVSVRNLTITRDFGATETTWKASTKTEGIIVENVARLLLDSVLVTGNRTGVYVHSSEGFIVRNSKIDQNRTGFQIWGNLNNGQILNNLITNNFTHGIVMNFDQGVTSANSLKISSNSISGNWYSQINLQRATSTPAGNVGDLNGMDISCNWYGMAPPVKLATATTEPGYAAQTPSQFGGTNPGASDAGIRGQEAGQITTVSYLQDAGNTATIGFAPSGGCSSGISSDLTASILVSDLNFLASSVGTNRDFIVNISEINHADAVGNVKFRIQKLPGFTISYSTSNGTSNVFGGVPNTNGSWNFTEDSGFIYVETSGGFPAFTNKIVGFQITRKPAVPGNTTQNITVTLLPSTGGENNFTNNIAATSVTAN